MTAIKTIKIMSFLALGIAFTCTDATLHAETDSASSLNIYGAFYGDPNNPKIENVLNGDLTLADGDVFNLIAKEAAPSREGGYATIIIPKRQLDFYKTFLGLPADPAPGKAKVTVIRLADSNNNVITPDIVVPEGQEYSYPLPLSSSNVQNVLNGINTALAAIAAPSTAPAPAAPATQAPTPTPAATPAFTIVSAQYGAETAPGTGILTNQKIDVTKIVQATYAKYGCIAIPAQQAAFFANDPAPGVAKVVVVTISTNGVQSTLRGPQGVDSIYPSNAANGSSAIAELSAAMKADGYVPLGGQAPAAAATVTPAPTPAPAPAPAPTPTPAPASTPAAAPAPAPAAPATQAPTPTPAPAPAFTIVSAQYGAETAQGTGILTNQKIDVTKIVQATYAKYGCIAIPAQQAAFFANDPAPGVDKVVVVTISTNGVQSTLRGPQGIDSIYPSNAANGKNAITELSVAMKANGYVPLGGKAPTAAPAPAPAPTPASVAAPSTAPAETRAPAPVETRTVSPAATPTPTPAVTTAPTRAPASGKRHRKSVQLSGIKALPMT